MDFLPAASSELEPADAESTLLLALRGETEGRFFAVGFYLGFIAGESLKSLFLGNSQIRQELH
jgi:hypothetical protein